MKKLLLSDFLNPTSFDPESFDPSTWNLWQPLPVHFVGSPKSERYPAHKNVVDINLDTIVEALSNTSELHIMPEEDLNAFETNFPHPDGKRWCSTEHRKLLWECTKYHMQFGYIEKV